MYNMGWFGVIRGYSRSTAMLPFDGRETALMDTLCLTRIVYTTWHIMLNFSDFQLLPPAFGAALGMVPF